MSNSNSHWTQVRPRRAAVNAPGLLCGRWGTYRFNKACTDAYKDFFVRGAVQVFVDAAHQEIAFMPCAPGDRDSYVLKGACQGDARHIDSQTLWNSYPIKGLRSLRRGTSLFIPLRRREDAMLVFGPVPFGQD